MNHHPLVCLGLALLLSGCVDGGGKSGDDTGTSGESDCAPVTATAETWTEPGSIDGPNAVSSHSIVPPATAGEGLVEATLSFEAYPGDPRLDLLGISDPEVVVGTAISLPPDDPDYAPLKLVWEMTAAQAATLNVTEFLPSTEESDYPVDYTLTLTWTPTPDCWEENDSPAEAARMPAGEVHEAWLSGALSDSTLRDVDDDWSVVALPEEATAVTVELTFPAEGIIPLVELYADDAGSVLLNSASAYYADGIPLSVEAEVSGAVWVRVTDRYGVEYAYGEPFDPSGTPRPAHFDAPYTLTVTPR